MAEDKKDYVVASPIRSGGKKRAVGEPLQLAGAIGDPLVERGILAVPNDSPAIAKADLLVMAIGRLDPANPEHYTGGGKPQTSALADIVKGSVSAAERDVAFEAYQTQHDGDKQ